MEFILKQYEIIEMSQAMVCNDQIYVFVKSLVAGWRKYLRKPDSFQGSYLRGDCVIQAINCES